MKTLWKIFGWLFMGIGAYYILSNVAKPQSIKYATTVDDKMVALDNKINSLYGLVYIAIGLILVQISNNV